MFQQALHTFCVKQLRVAANLSLSLITPLLAFAVVGVISAAPAHAQLQDIDSFANCINNLGSAMGSGATVAAAAAMCLPSSSSCYTTVTMSSESAQPACTLSDGTRLPRVILSCPSTAGSQLRFRPSFSLCTQSVSPTTRVINHIEVGEDSGVVRDSQQTQTMGDITLPSLDINGNFVSLSDAAVCPTGTNCQPIQLDNADPQKGCANCHDAMGHTKAGVNLFAPVAPDPAEGTIFTNDPYVRGPQAPAVPTPLSVICAGIESSTVLKAHPDRLTLTDSLCKALQPLTN
ncbi:MAG TPA: hypothetical protein VG498_10310 [Terriglobales bacterium]|nr:hypothetical protein [Terriglobales bacterium]